MGYVYLIRFDTKLSNKVQYYIGYTPRHPLERLKTHRAKRGAKILAAAVESNIKFHMVRIWTEVDKNFERSLKNTKQAKRYCPISNPKMKQHLYEHHLL